jgi:hypothetical protein
MGREGGEGKQDELNAYNERMDESVIGRQEQNFHNYSIYPTLYTIKGYGR